jgi:hypothetical protein
MERVRRDVFTLQVSGVQVVGGVFLLATLSTLLANTAAYYVTGESQLGRAILPGVTMSVAGLSEVFLPVAAVICLALVLDFLAVTYAYNLDQRRSAMIVIGHFTLTVVVAVVVQNSLALYQTRPPA